MYEKYFGLREPPFNLTPNPRIFFSHSSWQEAFATLCYGVEQRKGIIVVTGEAGTGKTTLLKMFVQSAGATVQASCILDPHLNFVELLRCAFTVFGLSADAGDRPAIARRFHDYLLEQLAQDHLVVLLLDEAQDISDEVLNELSLLSDLENNGAKLLQIIFVGQPEFESKLERPLFQRLKQRVALRSRLTPLDDEEIRPYIEFRLTAAGYRGNAIFLDAAVERIGFYSKGIPRLINIICDHALLIACATSQTAIGAETIEDAADGLQLGERYARLSSARLTVPPERVEGFHAAPSDISIDVTAPGRRPLENFGDESDDHGEDRVSRAEPADFELPAGVTRPGDEAQRVEFGGETFAFPPGEPSAHHVSESRWVGLSVALATLITVFGVVELNSPRRLELVATPAPVAEGIATVKELFAPIPGRIYRVLQQSAPVKDSFDSPALEVGPVFNPERSPNADSLPATEKSGSAPDQKKESKPSVAELKEKIAPSRAEHAVSIERRPGRFEVVENSYVRKAPDDKAEVVATLRPGTRIQLIRRTGEYLQVRSLEQEAIRGYVHREDAFFRPS
jgi:general secretion pathway protein A